MCDTASLKIKRHAGEGVALQVSAGWVISPAPEGGAGNPRQVAAELRKKFDGHSQQTGPRLQHGLPDTGFGV